MLVSELIKKLQQAVAQWYDRQVVWSNADWSKGGDIVNIDFAEDAETWKPTDVVLGCSWV